MTEEKQLLLKDLCARLPYQLNVKFGDHGDGILSAIIWKGLYVYVCDWTYGHGYECRLSEVRPYLRPMSSMTDEEMLEFDKLGWRVDELDNNNPWNIDRGISCVMGGVDWLNLHNFDYRKTPDGKTLIEAGLALEAPEGMYKTE